MRLSRMLLAVLFLAAGAASAQLPTRTWSEYKPAGAGFSIQMPGTPKLSTNSVETSLGPIEAYNAVVDFGNIAYYVSYNNYPAAHVQKYSAQQILDGVRNGQIKDKTLVSERPITINGRQGRELQIITANFGMLSRIVLVGTRLIQTIYIGAPGSETSADARRFADSLALTP